jgi:hypothetical protein
MAISEHCAVTEDLVGIWTVVLLQKGDRGADWIDLVELVEVPQRHREGPGECRQGVSGVATGPTIRQNAGARRTTTLRAPDSDDAAGRTKGF